MTVQSTVARADYQGNGVTTLFTVPFYFIDNSHIKVVRTDNSTVPPTAATLVLGTDYVLTGAGVQIGGQIQTTVAPTSAQTLTVLRSVPFTQLIHYVPNDPFPAATHEQALDQLTMEVQELNEVAAHALQFPSYEAAPPALPAASIRAGNILGFNSTGGATLLPMPASVGAGDLRTDVFSSGTGFTPGTTTSLTLSRAPGAAANMAVHFDAGFQGPDQYSLSGAVVTFTSPIPVGIQTVYVTSGTSVSLSITPDGSVTDVKVAAGSRLYNRTHGVVYVTDPEFGAKGDGITDDTAAFQAAIATGLPVFLPKPATAYYIKAGGINCTTAGQKIFGAGKDVSVLKLDANSNLSATGLFISTTAGGGEGPQFSDFQVTYVQPDTAVRANLTNYPVTFYSQGTQRCTWTNLKIQQASYIIDMRNNPGGNNITGCEFSWYNIAINIEGTVDSIKIDRCHFWPFTLTSNQISIFYDNNCIAVNTGRCDNLHIDNSLFINGRQINAFQGATGPTFGSITNCDFDTNIGIQMSAGSLDIASCYFSNGFAATQAIIMTGGSITGTACRFAVGLTLTNAQVSIQGGGASFILGDSYFETGTADFSAIALAATTTVMLSNVYFDRAANLSYGAATINQIGGVLTVEGCRTPAKGTGTGSFIVCATDDVHVIRGNVFNGWTVGLPAGHVQLLFDGNVFVNAGRLQHGFINSTTDGAGHVVVNHNFGTAPVGVLINVSNASSPIFAQPDSFTANTFRITFWGSTGALLTSAGISFTWEMKF